MNEDRILNDQTSTEETTRKETGIDKTIDPVPVFGTGAKVPVKISKKDAEIHNNVERQEALRQIYIGFKDKCAIVERMLKDTHIRIDRYTQHLETQDIDQLLAEQEERYRDYVWLVEEIEKLRKYLIEKVAEINKNILQKKIDKDQAREAREELQRKISDALKEGQYKKDLGTGIISMEVFDIISELIEKDKQELDNLTRGYKNLNVELDTLREKREELEGNNDEEAKLEEIEKQEENIKEKIKFIEWDIDSIQKKALEGGGHWTAEHHFAREKSKVILAGDTFIDLLGKEGFFHMLFRDIFGAVIFVTEKENQLINKINRDLWAKWKAHFKTSTLYKEVEKKYGLDLIQLTKGQWNMLINKGGEFEFEQRWNLSVKIQEDIVVSIKFLFP